MSEMRIYIANLGAYNNGESIGDWFDLPVDMEEVNETIFEPHELDENGQPMGDFAIHDYELPFQISEYESIDTLNRMAEELEGVSGLEEIASGDYEVEDVLNFASDTGMDSHVEDVISAENMNDLVKSRMGDDPSGWVGAKNLLSNIRDVDADYFLIDGYENVQDLESNHLKSVVSDMFDEIKSGVQGEITKERERKQKKNQELEM